MSIVTFMISWTEPPSLSHPGVFLPCHAGAPPASGLAHGAAASNTAPSPALPTRSPCAGHSRAQRGAGVHGHHSLKPTTTDIKEADLEPALLGLAPPWDAEASAGL